MKHLFKFLAISIIFAGLVSFKNNDQIPNANVTFKAALKSGSDLPVSTSTTGIAILTFNTTTKIFSLTVTYTGPTAVSGDIYIGTANGPIVFPLSELTSPITYTSTPLNAEQEANLYANLYELKLHSTAFPDNEIRGRLIQERTESGSGPPPPPGYNKE